MLDLVGNPEDGFSHIGAHIVCRKSIIMGLEEVEAYQPAHEAAGLIIGV